MGTDARTHLGTPAKEHNARATAQIALVSSDEKSRLNLYVKPDQEVSFFFIRR